MTSPTVESPMNRHRPGQWGQSAFASSFGSSLGGPASLLTSQSCVGVIVVRRTHRPRSAPRFSATTVARFRDSSAPRRRHRPSKNDASQALIFPKCPYSLKFPHSQAPYPCYHFHIAARGLALLFPQLSWVGWCYLLNENPPLRFLLLT